MTVVLVLFFFLHALKDFIFGIRKQDNITQGKILLSSFQGELVNIKHLRKDSVQLTRDILIELKQVKSTTQLLFRNHSGWPSLHEPQFLERKSSFVAIKRLRVFTSPPGWVASPPQVHPQHWPALCWQEHISCLRKQQDDKDHSGLNQ